MISEVEILQQKFTELLAWEKVKRRREILASIACYSLVAALVLLPFHSGFLPVASRAFLPLLIFLALAPWLFYRQHWRPRDSQRALARMDKTLRFEERAVTAWEILSRGETSVAEKLVIDQAADRVRAVEPKTLFPRQPSWRDYLVLPLLALWGAFIWLEVGVPMDRNVKLPRGQTLAHQLREFSRELQERAKREELSESLQVGRELEKAAQKGIDAKIGDEKFKSELSGLAKKVETMGRSASERQSYSLAESQESLRDLKAELEAAKDLLNFPEVAKGEGDTGQRWLDRLAMLPQLKKQMDQAGQRLGQTELQSFLDKLNQQVAGELDRRTLLEAQQFLEQLMKQGQGDRGESNVHVAERGDQDAPGDGEKAKSRSSLPGKEPGKREDTYPSLPEFRAGAPAHVKGMLGEGNSSGLVFKGSPSAGKSEMSQEDVVASYRRQAEAELNTERVPEALKETIKKYFLSLGVEEGKR